MLYREGFPRNFNDEVAWLYLMTDDVEMGQLELDPEDEANVPGIKILRML